MSESHFTRIIEGKIVSPTRFEGTATLEYLVATRCVENYALVGTPTTEPATASIYAD